MSEKHALEDQSPEHPGGGEQRAAGWQGGSGARDESPHHMQGQGVGAAEPQIQMGGYYPPPYPYFHPHMPYGNPYGQPVMGYAPGHSMPYSQEGAYGPPGYVQAQAYYPGYHHSPAPSQGGERMAPHGPAGVAPHHYGNPEAPANPTPGKHAGGAGLIDNLMGNDDGLFSHLAETLGMDDKEFWKGALVGAAMVLLLTNESVKSALFKTAAGAKEKVATGASVMKDKVKAEAFKEAGGAPQEQGEASSTKNTESSQKTGE